MRAVHPTELQTKISSFGFGRKLAAKRTYKKKHRGGKPTLKLGKLLFYRSEGERDRNKRYVAQE